MANYQPTYLGEIELSEDSLAHYGVKGMKWRRRKGNLKKTTHDKGNRKNPLDKHGIDKTEQRRIKFGLGNKADYDRIKRGARFMDDNEQGGRTVIMNPWTMDGTPKSSNLPKKRITDNPGTRRRRRFSNWRSLV